MPVSTEGESRELLLRNMRGVPIYVLEGSQDRNIRGIGGPRAMQEILVDLGHDVHYREFSDRSHEGFGDHYGDVLRWLDSRPRRRDPHLVLRVPSDAIMPVARRVHWIECDTRQALLRARVVDPGRIEIEVHRARDTELERLVALKRMRPDVASDAEARRRLLREARITGRLEPYGETLVVDWGLA